MYLKKIALLLTLAFGVQTMQGNMRVLNLDSCRTLAIENNKDLRMADMERVAAHYNRKSAFTNYLPKVSATGISVSYTHLTLPTN